MTTAIRVKGVSKEYRLGELGGYKTLRESLTGAFSRSGRRRGGGNGTDRGDDRIWALKDVSFDVEAGEVVGIIGHNGAGKTTLLKILSRITEPTGGEIELFGRVSSLLEVGTGFHPELTGRENIFLNGSILGMRRREIAAKFDEIVDFSGVERFLDTPVKRYSTGMQVRLAFAVAAHLEPEILLVDEVLAVGDAKFQRKCLGKMGEMADGGRTIIFVSHNMVAVEALCNKCIILEKGCIERTGPTVDTISAYLDGISDPSGEFDFSKRSHSAVGQSHALQRFRILTKEGLPASQIPLGEDIIFEISGSSEEHLENASLNIKIDSALGQRVAAFPTQYQYPNPISINGNFTVRCHVNNCRLMPGTYKATLLLTDGSKLIDEVGPIVIEVSPRDVYKTGKVMKARTGFYIPDARWEIVTRV